jgi:hypothetical protein
VTVAKYKDVNFRPDSLALIAECQTILDRYEKLDLRVTLRQLYYQLVVANVVPNSERSYKRVGSLLSDARIAGLVDWDAVEDRVRQPTIPAQWTTLRSFGVACAPVFRLPRREDQHTYLELWVEKDALANVLAPIAREYHITLSVHRGSSSSGAMHDAALRFRRARIGGQACQLLYLGDHDPSGEDMVRDIADRLEMFLGKADVEKVALTREQIDHYQPPPNPAKTTDSRYAKYAEQHGDESWEVDAIPPDVLATIVRDAIEEYTDMDAYNAVIEREDEMRTRLESIR